jgi:hypothetical protein
LNRGFGILRDDRFNAVFSLIKRGNEDPRQLIFHILPQALDGIELRTVGRSEQTDDILRDTQRFGLMTAPIIHDDNIQCVRIVLGKLMQQDLEVDAVQVG